MFLATSAFQSIHKPSWRRSSFPHHRATRTDTGLGKQTLGGHTQNLVHTRTQEKGAVTPQGTDPDLPVSVQESLVEAWVSGGMAVGRYKSLSEIDHALEEKGSGV